MTAASSPAIGGPGDHTVQFYGADDELAVTVAGYIADGLRAGDGVLVVATAPHRRVFDAALAAAGVDLARERAAGSLLTEDAAELLGRFLGGDGLDHDRFKSVSAGLIRRAAADGRPVRVYAEIVAVLWDAGHVGLAVELEALWNELAGRLPFALLCGYPSRVLSRAETAPAARKVRRLHSAVIDADPVVEQRSFPPELDSVRAARHFVTGLLDQEADQALAGDAAIVATELAANAVLHARSGFTLTVARSAAAVRIAVADRTPLATPPGPRDAQPPSERAPLQVRPGHGLSVVSQLASEWAVEQRPDGKVVWAELAAGDLSEPG